jgi:AcrR family transcriptional regulator
MKRLKSTHKSSAPRKQRIIQAALRCFTEKGYIVTSISDVCAMSGTSVGSLYHHFKSKEQLAATVYLAGISNYQTGLIEEVQKRPAPEEGIYAIVRFHLEWVRDNSDWARFLMQYRHAGFMDSTEQEFAELNDEFNSIVAGWFRANVQSGAFRTMPPALYFCIVLGPCQEYTRLYLSHGYSDIETAVEVIASAALRAIST